MVTTNLETPNIIKMVMQFLPFVLIIAIFYFFMIRPQNKQRQVLINMINNLKEGDKIITKGGIIGTISSIQENTFLITMHDGVKIEILKHAVVSLVDGNQK